MSWSERQDRRQRALEAAYDMPQISDAARGSETVRAMLGEAVSTATRVRLTDEVLSAFRENASLYERGLKAAFEAAGFEVEE